MALQPGRGTRRVAARRVSSYPRSPLSGLELEAHGQRHPHHHGVLATPGGLEGHSLTASIGRLVEIGMAGRSHDRHLSSPIRLCAPGSGGWLPPRRPAGAPTPDRPACAGTRRGGARASEGSAPGPARLDLGALPREASRFRRGPALRCPRRCRAPAAPGCRWSRRDAPRRPHPPPRSAGDESPRAASGRSRPASAAPSAWDRRRGSRCAWCRRAAWRRRGQAVLDDIAASLTGEPVSEPSGLLFGRRRTGGGASGSTRTTSMGTGGAGASAAAVSGAQRRGRGQADDVRPRETRRPPT